MRLVACPAMISTAENGLLGSEGGRGSLVTSKVAASVS